MNVQILDFFGGKGGVGKTTVASAFALNLSDEISDQKILLASFGPVRTLSDLFKRKLSSAPSKLLVGKGEGGLFAAEFEPGAAVEAFLKDFKPGIDQAAVRGKILSEDDSRKILEHLPPGTDELLHLLQVMEWLESGAFNRVVLDTAPTTYTLRLLDRPQAFKKFLAIVRSAEKALGKIKKPVPVESPLEKFGERVDRLAALIRNPAKTAFHLVTLAEPAPEVQTRGYFAQLREREVPVAEILVNEVEDNQGCPACQGRRGLQAPHVRKLQQLDKNVPVYLLARREIAPRGLEALKKLGNDWAQGQESKSLEFAAAEGPPALVRAPSMPPIAAPPLHPTRLIFFVGPGGAGKSSCAAAAAVTLTEKEGPVLLISTDPGHSLSEILQSRLTDTETQVRGTKGLYARELDARGWFNGLRRQLKEKAEALFDAQGRTNEVLYDREILRNLLDTIPVDAEDLAALSALTDALIQERFKRIVVDPAPSGDAFDLVTVPDRIRPWLSSLLAVLVKYRAKGTGDLADQVAVLLKKVKRFEEAMLNPNEARFVVVTRGEELAIPKTERLVEFLKGRQLAVERVLVNRVLPKSTCPKCENRRKLELLAAKALEKKLAIAITVAPALGRHPAGLRELKAFRTSWYALSATAKIKAA